MVVTGAKDLENASSPDEYLAGYEELVEVRASAVFTTSYVNSSELNISHAKSFVLFINLNGTTIANSQLKVQFSDINKTLWYDLSVLTFDTLDIPTNNPTLRALEIEMGGLATTRLIQFPNPGASWVRFAAKANAASGGLILYAARSQSNAGNPMIFAGT